MSRAALGLAMVLGAMLLAACGEKPQTVDVSAKKSDTRAFEGGQSLTMAAGWKPGDGESWEEQMRRRVQHQNEYVRVK